MRLLVIAYEFPPSPSPQSLRWAYLSRGLAELGHDVHILTVDLGPDDPGLPAMPAGVQVHRTWPGPLRGITAWSRKRNIDRVRAAMDAAHSAAGEQAVATTPPTAAGPTNEAAENPGTPSLTPRTAPKAPFEMPKPTRLGAIKALVWSILLRIGEYIVFPDIRGEWSWPARKRLQALLRAHDFDAVICSHEPATTLQLGLLAHARGIPFVADLGDPVLAGYTPPRWRRKSLRLERNICRRAALVTVTADSAAALLRQRHRHCVPIHVVTQGFPDAAIPPLDIGELFDPGRLELLYTGSFYSFRRPEALLDAVLGTPGARLNVATVQAPPILRRVAREHPDKVRILGFLPHLQALQLQRQADVLVNIANADSSQVPGKLYEYAGACRPILHIAQNPENDPSADWIQAHQRGWVVPDTAAALTDMIARIATDKRDGQLGASMDLSMERVSAFSWTQGAALVDALLQTLPRPGHAMESTPDNA